MAVTITYPTLTNPANKSEVETNFSDLVNKFGNITDADISASAGIGITKLANQYQEMWVQLVYINGAQGAWPAAGATTPLAVVAIPGANGDPAWSATSVNWVCSDTGTTAGSFDVNVGYYNAGAWANTTSVIAAVSMPVVGAGNLGNQGTNTGLTVSVQKGATQAAIALMSAGVGVAVLNGGVTDFLHVSVLLRRQIQA